MRQSRPDEKKTTSDRGFDRMKTGHRPQQVLKEFLCSGFKKMPTKLASLLTPLHSFAELIVRKVTNLELNQKAKCIELSSVFKTGFYILNCPSASCLCQKQQKYGIINKRDNKCRIWGLVWHWEPAMFISCNRNLRTFPSVKAGQLVM